MKSDETKEQPIPLPSKFHASLDPADANGYAVLQSNDEMQRALALKTSSPFVRGTPLEHQRSKALVQIKAIEATVNYTPESIEYLAEQYAVVGNYIEASRLTQDPNRKDLYERYWQAVCLDDAAWCNHGSNHIFVREIIFSFKTQREMPLLACGVCGIWNVADSPESLRVQIEKEREINEATKDMSPNEVKHFLERAIGKQ